MLQIQDLKQLEIDIENFENASTWVQSCKELLNEVQRMYAEGNKPVDDSELAGEVELLRGRVASLSDAYRSEKELADKLQAQLDAQPQVEAVGWFYHPNAQCVTNLYDYFSVSFVPDETTRRRIFVGPAEPIQSEVK